jgi:hypothetical protein
MKHDKLKQYINTNLVQEQDILDGSYIFFDALSAETESINLIDNTRNYGFK